MENSETSPSHQQSYAVNPYKLACGLFLSDLWKALFCIILCSVVSVVGTLFPTTLLSESIYSLCFERALQLLCLFWITHSWLSRLRIEKKPLSAKLPIRFFLIGILLWGALMSPVIILTIQPSLASISFFLLALGIYYSIIYFYYFLPTLFNSRKSLRDVLLSCKELSFGKFSTVLKIYSCSGIFGLTYYSLLSAYTPDGRTIELQALSQIWIGIFFVFSTYLALAFGLLSIPDSMWREEKLDPYKKERLETLSKIGKPLHLFLSPQGLFVVFLLGFFCFLGNYARSLTTPPPPTITLINAVAKDSSVEITLKLTDEAFMMRGTYPLMFALRSEQGNTVSAYPKTVTDMDSKEDQRFIIPSQETTKNLILTFETDRSGKALTDLEDLYLWYNKVKLLNVKIKEPS